MESMSASSTVVLQQEGSPESDSMANYATTIGSRNGGLLRLRGQSLNSCCGKSMD